MSAATKLSQKMHSVAAAWPNDPFRPNLQLKTLLKALADHPRLTQRAVTAANVLRNNAVKSQYPLSVKVMEPASQPLHYHRLVEAFEKSAKGIGRPFWKRFFGIW